MCRIFDQLDIINGEPITDAQMKGLFRGVGEDMMGLTKKVDTLIASDKKNTEKIDHISEQVGGLITFVKKKNGLQKVWVFDSIVGCIRKVFSNRFTWYVIFGIGLFCAGKFDLISGVLGLS